MKIKKKTFIRSASRYKKSEKKQMVSDIENLVNGIVMWIYFFMSMLSVLLSLMM